MKNSKKPIDVVLIYPKTGVDFGSAVAPPFSVISVAAPLRNRGLNVKIIDQRVDQNWAAYLREALKDKPICCGISTMTGRQISFGIEAAKVIREETGGSVPIVWGGVHPTLVPEQTARSQYVDLVCLREGEETFADLVATLQNGNSLSGIKGIAYLDDGKYIFTEERPFINIEELLPIPWDLINVESYINSDMYLRQSSRVLDIGQTSRGCPYSCAYCYNPVVHHSKWRAMSAEKVVDMIVENVKRFSLDGIWLRDDEFFLDLMRVSEICEGIIANNLNISWYTSGVSITDILRATKEQLKLIKRSGAHVMRIGAESGSNRILRFMNKRQNVGQILEINRICKEFGFKPVYSLMFGFPTETFDEIDETIDLFFKLKKDNPDASLAPLSQFTAFPGTPLYDMAIGMGLKPPQRFEDWAEWLSTEIDFNGERMPWLKKKERRWIGNVTYLGNLSFAGADIVSSVSKNSPLEKLFTLIVKTFSKYFAWRLRIKSYRFVPEIKLIIKASQFYLFLLNRNGSKKLTRENEDKG